MRFNFSWLRHLFDGAFIFLGLGFSFLSAFATDLDDQRQDFRAAREALARKDSETFARLLPGLVGYPLYGYLVHDDLKVRLADAADSEVQTFLTRYADLPVAETLRNAWLKRLAQEDRWSDFLINYRETQETALRCLRIRARIATREEGAPLDQTLIQELKELWFVGKQQAPECEDTLTVWQEIGGITQDDLWRRVTLAFESGNVSLAEDLGARLPATDRAWVRVWARVHRDPRAGLEDPLLVEDGVRARTVVCDAVARLARENILTAINRWEALQEHYSFTAAERWTTERSIALRAASSRHASALELLERLSFTDADVRRARVRAALWAGNWSAVLHHTRELKPWEQKTDRWRYWEARALEETGRPGAKNIHSELASHRGYHGFLAADHLNRPYAFNHRPLIVADEDLANLERKPAMIRAREWFLTDYLSEGRREWMAAIGGSDARELSAAALLAARWNWPDRVIATLGRSTEENDLVLRFPLPYQRQVMAQAVKAGISPAVIFAVARQESIFMPDVRSPAGALGLMQLMPATATQVARRLKVPFAGASILLDPEYNLRIGSAFLAQMIDHQGSLALAAAAYNAGPGRVKQWRPRATMAADAWIESIPFDETRRYVRNVLTYAAIYGWRLNLAIQRLADAMSPVNP
ncbi:soluble lytic murein transglycosylase [Gammaproteobacteria bacterium]